MKLRKLRYKVIACFSAEELTNLLLLKDFRELINLSVNNTLDNAGKKVKILAEKQSKLRDSSELWSAVFGLYQEFESACEICLQLKDIFNPNRNSIKTVEDLIQFKQDPPDVVILYKGSFYEFELKRYFGSIGKGDLLSFIGDKILRYSDPYNFYVMLQPEKDKIVVISVFEQLHQEIEKLNLQRTIGIISFTFNADNQYILTIQVHPDFKVSKYPFQSGSEQVANIIKG